MGNARRRRAAPPRTTGPEWILSGTIALLSPDRQMDTDYLKNLGPDGTSGSEFTPSLFVYATVMSRPTKDRAVLDAGLKALSVDSGMPWVVGMPDVEYIRASDEHGKLTLHDPDRVLPLGSKVRLIPGHCDPTVNLHDWYVCCRNDRVESLWPITARGAVF